MPSSLLPSEHELPVSRQQFAEGAHQHRFDTRRDARNARLSPSFITALCIGFGAWPWLDVMQVWNVVVQSRRGRRRAAGQTQIATPDLMADVRHG